MLQIAKKAASEAGNLILEASVHRHQSNTKEGIFDLVSQVDLQAETKIIEIISQSFPDHNILSEEKGLVDHGSEYIWVIDPLDGTISFLSGIPHFSVSVGLLKNNQPILGVVNKVVSQKLLWAQVGQGAFLNGQKTQVSQTTTLSEAILGSDLQNTHEARVKDWQRNTLFFNKARYLYLLGGAVHSVSIVAEGHLDGYVHACKPWDFVAVSVLVSEAGGKVTDWHGQPIDWTAPVIEAIFSNGLIHDQIVEVLEKR